MLCSNCGKSPAQRYTRSVNGKEVTLHLCAECYRALYPEKKSDFFPSLLKGVGERVRACPACGTMFEEFRRTGLLGCAQCYTAFRAELTDTVRGIQGKVGHTGRRPDAEAEKKYDEMREYVVRREQLKERLEQALRMGDYETARQLQRALKALNGPQHGGVQ